MKPALSFEAQYGSENYRLNRPDSDVDMMYFYNPSFVDLYEQKMASDHIEDTSTDRKHHDVRKLPVLFYKANINFLEILFSCRVIQHDQLHDTLAAERDVIAAMNLPYLFDGCMGMFNRNYGLFQRDAHYVTREDMLNEDMHRRKIGKHAAGAYRSLDFMKRYLAQGFTMFGAAIAYFDHTAEDRAFRDLYMTMRDGKLSFSEMDAILKEKEAEANALKPYYKERVANEEVNQFVIETVHRHVQEHMFKDLLEVEEAV